MNELKAAGAEAVAVNEQRLVVTSSIRNAGPTILINNTPQVPPYVIKAIGNPKTLLVALTMHGGIAIQLKAFDPAMFSVLDGGTLTLPAYSGGVAPRYARPASGAPTTEGQGLAAPLVGQSSNREAVSEQDIHFLDSQIALTRIKTQRAEAALNSYRAQHPTHPNQRRLADLMRDYSTLDDEYVDLVKRRDALKVQFDLSRFQRRSQKAEPARASTPALPANTETTIAALEAQVMREKEMGATDQRPTVVFLRRQINALIRAEAAKAQAGKAKAETDKLVRLKAKAAKLEATIHKPLTAVELPRPVPTPTGNLHRPFIIDKATKKQRTLVFAAAQQDLAKKKASLRPGDPARLAAERRVEALLNKQEFLVAVHQNARNWVRLYNWEADREKGLRKQLQDTRQQIKRLETEMRAQNNPVGGRDGSAGAR